MKRTPTQLFLVQREPRKAPFAVVIEGDEMDAFNASPSTDKFVINGLVL